MVRRVFDIMYKEVRGLHQAAYVLALFAFGSQILALVRDRLLAHNFGAGAELDIYYAAFRLPDILFVLFASTLSVYVLIPFVSRAGGNGGKVLSQVFTLFLFFYSIFALVVFVSSPYILPKLFPGIADQESLLVLSRLLLLQPFLLGVSSLFGVVTQLGHRFVIYAISPLVYNIGIIIGIMALYPIFGLYGLGLGVVLGALMHLFVQLPFVLSSQLRIGATFKFDWKQIGSILTLSLPRALTLSMQQIVFLVLLGFASALTVGSVSIFQFAYNLQSVPLAIIGVSYSVAAFPILAELFSQEKKKEFALHIETALRHIIFWSIPVIALIIVLRAQVVRVVLGSGEFDWSDTRLTAAVLAIFAISLLAQAVILVVTRAFYAGGKTLVPFLVTLIGSCLSVATSYGFLQLYLKHEYLSSVASALMRLQGVEGSEILAVALGYTLAVVLQAVTLLIVFSVIFKVRLSWIWEALFHAFGAALVAALFAYVALNFVVEGIEQARLVGIMLQGVIAGCAGIFGAAITYSWFRSPELHEVYQSFQKKIFKTDVVAPQEEVI